jgi:hypothetical protein
MYQPGIGIPALIRSTCRKSSGTAHRSPSFLRRHNQKPTLTPGFGVHSMARKSAPKKAAKKAAATKAPGIGRSAITGKFMSVAAAKAHKKTAMVVGAGKKKK